MGLDDFETKYSMPDDRRQPDAGWACGEIVLERYRIKELVQTGGESEVYRAFDTDFPRDVAIKRMKRHHSKLAVNRWRRATAPGIVPLLHVLEFENGRVAFVMPWIVGETIDAVLKSVSGSSAQMDDTRRAVLARLAEISQSIGSLNRQGIIHADLKPMNFILSNDQESIWACDWTACQTLAGTDEAQFELGEMRGTDGFASDEIKAGHKDTHSADTIGLARTIYYVVTGRQLPNSDKAAIDVLLETPVTTAIGDGGDLTTLLARAIGKKLGSADRLGRELEYWLEGKPLACSSRGRRFSHYVVRHWATLGTLGLLMLAVLTINTQVARNDQLNRELRSVRDERLAAEKLQRKAAGEIQEGLVEISRQKDSLRQSNRLSDSRLQQRNELIHAFTETLLLTADADTSDSATEDSLDDVFSRVVSRCRDETNGLTPEIRGTLLGTAGKYYYFTDDWDQARRLLRETVDLLDDCRDFPAERVRHFRHYIVLASLTEEDKTLSDAEPYAIRNLAETRAATGDNSEETAESLVVLGDLYKERRQFEDALELYEEALAIRKKVLPGNNHQTGFLLVRIGRVHEKSGRVPKAMECIGEGVETIRASGLEPTHRYLVAAETDLIRMELITGGSYDSLEPKIDKLLPRVESRFGSQSADAFALRNYLVVLALRDHKYEQGRDAAKAAVALLPKGDARLPLRTEVSLLSALFLGQLYTGEEDAAALTFTRVWTLAQSLPAGHPGRDVNALWGTMLHLLAERPAAKLATEPAVAVLKSSDFKPPQAYEPYIRIFMAEFALREGGPVDGIKDLGMESQPDWLKAWRLSVLARTSPDQTGAKARFEETIDRDTIPAIVRRHLKASVKESR